MACIKDGRGERRGEGEELGGDGEVMGEAMDDEKGVDALERCEGGAGAQEVGELADSMGHMACVIASSLCAIASGFYRCPAFGCTFAMIISVIMAHFTSTLCTMLGSAA